MSLGTEHTVLWCALLASESRILALVTERGRPADPDREAAEHGRQAGRDG